MKACRNASLLLLALLCLCAADEVSFIPATPENTTLEDGTALELAEGEVHPDARWYLHPTGGFAASGAPGNNAPLLRTLVTGLVPDTNYEVHGYFRANLPKFGDIRLGLAIAGMEGFAPDSGQGSIDLIGVQHPIQRVIRIDDADYHGFQKFRASLGIARTDPDGTLLVFADDHPHDRLEAGTLFAGVGIAPAPQDAAPDVGAGSPQVAVDAARAADSKTLWREIAAGADLNTPDREGRTALFYACIGGDHELAAALIKAGALPDCESQRLPPLWAAAHLGDTHMVRMLLDAGAKITTDCLFPKQLGTFGRSWKPNHQINPVSAAILSGCTATLELLLAQNPGIDVEKAFFGAHYDINVVHAKDRGRLIEIAVQADNFDMAAWLVGLGLSLEFPESWNLPRNENMGRSGPYSILLGALMRKKPQMSLVHALEGRGVPMIDRVEKLPDPVVVPWDGLSAAAFWGHIDLVRRWLPAALDVPLDYRIRLITLADASACDVTASLVREAFPDTPRPTIDARRTRWRLADFDRIGGIDGSSVPRTKRPENAVQREGITRIAVIGEGAADGPAASLAALASTHDGVEVVDRGEIQQLLDERTIALADLHRGGAINEIGDLLKADVIITASAFGRGDDHVLRFEAHDVLTGLTIHRAFQLATEFEPDVFARDYLGDTFARRAAKAAGDAATAITLIGVSADGSLPRGTNITSTLNAGLLQEIDATPGLIALTREQLAPLVEEQALGAEGGLWGTAWMIEGGVRAREQQGNVSLTLRATSSTSGEIRDVTVDGSASDVRDLVTRAWSALRESLDSAESRMHDDPGRAQREASRLAREAQWLLNSPLAAQAAPLADAAFYLGGPTSAALMLRLDAHWARSQVLYNPRRQWGGYSRDLAALGYPVAQDVHDFYLTNLESQLELLSLTLEAADRVLSSPPHRSTPVHVRQAFSDQVWSLQERLEALTAYRCRITDAHPDPSRQSVITEFDDQLAQLWSTWIDFDAGGGRRFFGRMLVNAQHTTLNFRKLPWLGNFLAKTLLDKAAEPARGRHEPWDFSLYLVISRRDILGSPCRESLADLLEAHIPDETPHAGLRRAEVAFLRDSRPGRPTAWRALAEAWIDTLASTPHPPSRLIISQLVSEGLPCFPMHGFASGELNSIFKLPLRSLVASPRHCPDMVFRHEYYLKACHDHVNLKIPPPDQIQAHGQGHAQQLVRVTNELVKKNAEAADYDLLMDIAREMDRTFGSNCTNVITPVVHRLRPPDDLEAFGKSGSFTYLRHDDALPGTLVADVRADVTEDPALITYMRADPANPHILWMILQPYENERLLMHPRLGERTMAKNPDLPVHKHPWLIAFDGNLGKVIHRINLIEAAFGQKADPRSSSSIGISQLVSEGIAFNDGELILATRWTVNRKSETRVLIVDRTSGLIVRSHPIRTMVNFTKLSEHTFPRMVGIGRDFFILATERAEDRNNILIRLMPEEDAVRLNEPGRRPPQSPFDDLDRNPRDIYNDDGKLLVGISDDLRRGHLAHYNLESGTWTDAPPPEKLSRHISRLREQHWNKNLEQRLDFPVEKFPRGRFTQPARSEPGCLMYLIRPRSLQTLRLPVRLQVDAPYPSTFMISPGVIPRMAFDAYNAHLEQNPPEKISIQDLSRSDMVKPAVVHETKDHLLLTQFIEIPMSISRGGLSPHHLPFIWKIEKSQVREELLRLSNEE